MVLADKAIFAPAWIEFSEEFGEMPLLHSPLDNIYKGWADIFTKIVAKYEIPGPDESVKTADTKLTDEVWVRVYTPPGATGSDPLGVYFHGGGWVLGSVDQEDAVCRIISKGCNMIVVSVEYRLAPKHKYPAALDDCVDGGLWAIKNASSIGANAAGAVLMGGSAGGGLALGAALKLIDQGMKDKVVGIVAVVPVTVHPDAVPEDMKDRYTSYEEHAEHTVNTKDAMMEFLAQYSAPPDDKYTSPLLHPSLKSLPKVYITESGADTLRDDARLMKEKLEKLGVQVSYDAYPGLPHYSWSFPSKHLVPHQMEFFGNLVKGVKWVLET